jgi:SAM-dependent methyltransferase
MHDEAFRYVVEQASKLNTEGIDVLDLGGRNVNGTTRELFRHAARYVSVDIRDGEGVDIVCDAADLDLGELFDVVVSTELLEHAERAAEIVVAARRHLKPGGKFIATMAGPGRRPHGASGETNPPPGEFYLNVEPPTLTSWLRDAGFDVWQVDQAGTDLRCVAEVTSG